MNRRGFFGALAAVVAAPKAVRLIAPEFVTVYEAWRVPSLTAEPLHLVGSSGWIPTQVDEPYDLDRTFRPSVMGRQEMLLEYLDEGWISQADFARLASA